MALTLVHFILNLAALWLWLNWVSFSRDPVPRTPATQLIATLKKAGPRGLGRWKFLAGIVILLVLRALIFWQLGPALKWTPRLDWGFVNLTFRADDFTQLLVFSDLGFLFILAIFYLWLLLLSVVNQTVSDADPMQKLVRHFFKWLEPWPAWLKLVSPLLAGGLLWLALRPLFNFMAVTPGEKFSAKVCEQAIVIGAGGYLAWKYLIAAILLLHLINSYVFFGDHPVWNFVNTTARNLLRPLRWLPSRIGRVDFLPLIGTALLFLLTELVANPPAWPPALRPWFYKLLPF